MSTLKVFRFTCGHVGRNNESWRSEVSTFIRVAEIRDAKVEESDKSCPDCK